MIGYFVPAFNMDDPDEWEKAFAAHSPKWESESESESESEPKFKVKSKK
jgi:hypothetical protein